MRLKLRPLGFFLAAGIAAASPLHAASVIYSDGLTHTLPGDPAFTDGDWIRLESQSRLVVQASVLVTGSFDTSAIEAFGGPAIVTAPCATARIGGGEIMGGDAVGILDETTPISGLAATGGAGVDLGSTGAGHEMGLKATGGAIRGGDASAIVDETIDRVEARGGPGLVLDGGTATLQGSGVGGGDATSEGSYGENVARSGDIATLMPGSILLVQGGTHTAGLAHAANGIYVQGNATAHGGHGLNLSEGATAVVHAGSIESGSAWVDADFVSGDATAIPGNALRADDGTRVAIYGGTFTTGFAATSSSGSPHIVPPVAALRLDVTGSANATYLTILGGTFRGDMSLEIPYTDATPPPGRSWPGAELYLVGGDFDSGGDVDLRLSHPGVFTILITRGTTTVNGNPITLPMPTSGTISGQLYMDPTFESTYELQNGAILLVPEPMVGLVPGLLTLGTFARFRQRLRHRTGT